MKSFYRSSLAVILGSMVMAMAGCGENNEDIIKTHNATAKDDPAAIKVPQAKTQEEQYKNQLQRNPMGKGSGYPGAK